MLWSSGAYTYDGAGQIASIGEQEYAYDGAGRLTEARVTEQAGLASTAPEERPERIVGYGYDRFGNMTSRTLLAGSLPPDALEFVYSHTDPGESHLYDASGGFTVDESDLSPDETNVLRVRRTTGGETAYSSTVSVGYDTTVTPSSANQTRSLSVTRTGGALEIRWELLTENGKPTRVLFRRASDGVTYVVTPFALQPGTELFDLGSLPGGRCDPDPPEPSGPAYLDSFHHRDHLGSLRVATDETGWAGPADRIDYYPFGLRLGAHYATQASRRQYTGHERDLDTGLDYMKARYATATLARFQSVDPIRGQPASPQSWNRFAYVRNNPLNRIDPTGMEDGTTHWHLNPEVALDQEYEVKAIWLGENIAQKEAAKKAIIAAIEKFASETGVKIRFGGWVDAQTTDRARAFLDDGVVFGENIQDCAMGLVDLASSGNTLVTIFTDQPLESSEGGIADGVTNARGGYLSFVATRTLLHPRPTHASTVIGHEWLHSFGVPDQYGDRSRWSYGGGRGPQKDWHLTHRELEEVHRGIGIQLRIGNAKGWYSEW